MLLGQLGDINNVVSKYDVKVIQTQRHEDRKITVTLSHNIYYKIQAKMEKALFDLGYIRGIIYKDVA